MNIKNVFNKHNLIIPDYDNPNFVDLMIALYTRFGTNIKKSKNSDSLSKQIPNNKHTLFILLDGAGSNLIDSLEDNSVLKENKQCNLLTVSPSTTGCVLTSLATAKYPSEHGIIGWFSYNREFDRDYYPLLYADRKSGKSLIEFGIKPEDIYKEKSLLNHLKIDTKVFFPNYINESVYSKFVINDINRISYQSISDAFEKINARINEIDKSYTYLYIPDIDSLSHECGVYSPLIKEKIKEIEYGIKLLFKNKNLTIVATADHGQIDVINDVVMDFYKYDKFFYALPGIDFGTATYYIKKIKRKNLF